MLESVLNRFKEQSAIEPFTNSFMERVISQSPDETEFDQTAPEGCL
jgi:hypothetical protein